MFVFDEIKIYDKTIYLKFSPLDKLILINEIGILDFLGLKILKNKQ